MYGVVMRTSFATAALPVRCLPSGTSPETMMLSSSPPAPGDRAASYLVLAPALARSKLSHVVSLPACCSS